MANTPLTADKTRLKLLNSLIGATTRFEKKLALQVFIGLKSGDEKIKSVITVGNKTEQSE